MACYALSTANLIGVWRRVHDHEGVRSIRLHKEFIEAPTSYVEIITTGRNCTYQILRILFPEEQEFIGELPPNVVDGWLAGVELQVVHRCSSNRGWIEGVFLCMLKTLTSSLQR